MRWITRMMRRAKLFDPAWQGLKGSPLATLREG
jgi:hypothetical protein